jgi:hypothetical protein
MLSKEDKRVRPIICEMVSVLRTVTGGSVARG